MARKNIIPESFSEGGKEKRITTFGCLTSYSGNATDRGHLGPEFLIL